MRACAETVMVNMALSLNLDVRRAAQETGHRNVVVGGLMLCTKSQIKVM